MKIYGEKAYTQEKNVIDRPILIIKKPNPFMSVLEDVFTFGGWIAILWFNHTYLDGHLVLDLFFVILWLMTASATQSRRVQRFATKEDAIEWLKDKK